MRTTSPAPAARPSVSASARPSSSSRLTSATSSPSAPAAAAAVVVPVAVAVAALVAVVAAMPVVAAVATSVAAVAVVDRRVSTPTTPLPSPASAAKGYPTHAICRYIVRASQGIRDAGSRMIAFHLFRGCYKNHSVGNYNYTKQ